MSGLYSSNDIRLILDALAQSAEILPPEVDWYRIGYLRALRDVGIAVDVHRAAPRPRLPLPDILPWSNRP